MTCSLDFICYHVEYHDSAKGHQWACLIGKQVCDDEKNGVQETPRTELLVRNLYRELYFLPRDGYNLADVQREVNARCKTVGVQQPKLDDVLRNYAYFRSQDKCPNHVREIGQPMVRLICTYRESALLQLNSFSRGQTFERVFGTTLNCVESLVLLTRLRLPCRITATEATRHETRVQRYVVPSPFVLHVHNLTVTSVIAPKLTMATIAFATSPAHAVVLSFGDENRIGFMCQPGLANRENAAHEVRRCFADTVSLWQAVLESLNDHNPDVVVGHGLTKERIKTLRCFGRLVFDLQTIADEFVGGNTSLRSLVRRKLKVDWPLQVAKKEPLWEQLCEEVLHIRELVVALNVFPLTLELTRTCGNLFEQSLMGRRSKRAEYLLMHAFYEHDYLVPDRLAHDEMESELSEHVTGGSVLDPKPGLYRQLVFLLDYESMYPSLVLEKSLCFTAKKCVLPPIMSTLLQQRREVKSALAAADPDMDLKQKDFLKIRQLALKLTANSIYGCLACPTFLYYYPSLAATITKAGRESLQLAQWVAERSKLNVIYGATDSIMLTTNCSIPAVSKARELVDGVLRDVNARGKFLRLKVDGVFSSVLMLSQKNRYAAKIYESGEILSRGIHRGDDPRLLLRIVERSLQILLEENISDVPRQLGRCLREFDHQNRLNQIPLQQYVMTRRLKKQLHSYPTGNDLHVAVAHDLPSEFHRAGAYIDYVITTSGQKMVERVQPAMNLFPKLDAKSSKMEVAADETAGHELDRDAYRHLVLKRVENLVPQ